MDVAAYKAQFAGTQAGPHGPKHTLNSIVKEMERAAKHMRAENKRLEEEEAALLKSIEQTVGSLSDLRYGRFANGQLRDSVLEGLKEFQEACDKRT